MTIHDVQANEDIAGVAMTYGVKAEEIRKLNGLGQDPIRPGQRLKIPIPSPAQ
jgi:LysM repeat protein